MLSEPCDILPGVGPALAAKLAKCGIHTLQDLLFHLPFRYQDRTRITAIADTRLHDWCVIVGKVVQTRISYGRKRTLHCYVEDKTGTIQLRFFHFNNQQMQAMNNSASIRIFGEIRNKDPMPDMVHPEYQLLDDETIHVVEETLTPIYPATLGLSQTRLRELINKTRERCKPVLSQLEWMRPEILQELGFLPFCESLDFLHNPPPDTCLQQLEQGLHPAMQRLAFDELLAQRLSMQFAKNSQKSLSSPPLPFQPSIQTTFLNNLPFKLTAAQQRVSEEIAQDLADTKPMLRLVQGDVGAGKTINAALAALQAIANGYQVAFMAPTDLLSEQHYKNLHHWFQPLGIQVERLSGKMKVSEKKRILTALKEHTCQLLIGTHALFQDSVAFAKPGLAIIDEQHRFGVEQRLSLQQKSSTENHIPHQLLMTATPIPRTLAMTHFAHLDLSILDELPPGRTPVITTILSQNKREPLIERLKNAINHDRQIYWVCPLIEESEKLQCMAATSTAEQLQQQLPEARIGLVHGRLKSAEKEAVMTAFKAGELELLVATTVIEVGVDVPKASLMIIENAERLGLSQLHQLRGRVGRGNTESHCILLYQSPLSQTSAERLRIMRDTTDGFLIAEKDLELRGSGEILGKRQTGYRQFKLADPSRDAALLVHLPEIANQLIQKKPETAKAIAKRWLGNFESFLQG